MATYGTPKKLGKFGIAIQSAKGVAAAAPSTVFPLPGDDSIAYTPGFEVLDWGDGTAYAHTIATLLEGVSGGLSLPLLPGKCVDIADWILTEDSKKQGKWATLFFDYGGIYTAAYADVKVASAEFACTGGALPTLSVTATGLRRITGVSLATKYADETAPYGPRDWKAEIKLTGGAYAEASNIHAVSFSIDRKLESLEDGAAIKAQAYAEYLSNTGGVSCEGSMSRRLTDGTLWTDIVAGTLGALKITLTSGSNSEVIEAPSVLWSEGDPHIGNGDGILATDTKFTALASGTHFVTPPVAWTSTAA